MNSPFQLKPLRPQTFFQKLFGRYPKENAISEINNLLAEKRPSGLEEKDLWQIALKYRLDFRKGFLDSFEQFYRDYLRHCLVDKCLSENEILDLNKLKNLFGLPDLVVNSIHSNIVSDIYKKGMEEAINDGNLTVEEKSFLKKLQSDLKLSDESVKRIKEQITGDFISRFVTSVIQDQRLSPDEEEQISALAKNLDINLQYEVKTKAILEKCRLFWVIENGDIPVVSVDLNLQRGEQCHFFSDVDWYEYRRVTKRIRYGGPTMRIKIVKGVYWTMGDLGVQKVSEDIFTKIDSGKAYITNKRLIFNGGLKNATIPHSKILDIVPYQNGIEIEKSSGKSPFLQFYSNVDVFAIILERVVRDYNSE